MSIFLHSPSLRECACPPCSRFAADLRISATHVDVDQRPILGDAPQRRLCAMGQIGACFLSALASDEGHAIFARYFKVMLIIYAISRRALREP